MTIPITVCAVRVTAGTLSTLIEHLTLHNMRRSHAPCATVRTDSILFQLFFVSRPVTCPGSQKGQSNGSKGYACDRWENSADGPQKSDNFIKRDCNNSLGGNMRTKHV